MRTETNASNQLRRVRKSRLAKWIAEGVIECLTDRFGSAYVEVRFLAGPYAKQKMTLQII